MIRMIAEPEAAEFPEHLVLEGVSWSLYQKLLRETRERRLYMTYDEGRLEIMAPLPEHEKTKKFIGGFIELISLERNIPMCRLGNTTFHRKKLAKGLEPDECYYIQHEEDVRGKKRLRLGIDPPPDLVVEVDVSYRAINRERIYAKMGVLEIWHHDRSGLRGLRLGSDEQYKVIQKSLAFPFLKISDIARFLDMFDEHDELTVFRSFRDWIREIPHSH
ncbi:MAG TPA: Uma2 family endonuclease [Tepidisphaeraceae bacterium]|jgi:Uma2 family endonuclease|nr:Uma2 family endonuclease [Tepidisphaeraceae bacterium]